MTSVGVIRGAGALRRNHGRAERRQRGAESSKCRTIVRLLDAFQNLSADAYRGFFGVDLFHVEELLGVVLAILPAKFVSALWDPPHTTPLAVRNFKNAVHQLACWNIAL